MAVEGLKTVRVDFGGGRGDTVPAFKRTLLEPLQVGEMVRALDDDGTERLARVVGERVGSFVLKVYPTSAHLLGSPSIILLALDEAPDVQFADHGQVFTGLKYEVVPGLRVEIVPDEDHKNVPIKPVGFKTPAFEYRPETVSA